MVFSEDTTNYGEPLIPRALSKPYNGCSHDTMLKHMFSSEDYFVSQKHEFIRRYQEIG